MEPFRVAIPDAALDDLRRRVRATRWPPPETDPAQGVPLAEVQRLAAYWADGYDWRACETRINAFGQVVHDDIHALHVRSADPDALPLLLTHGWPGSVVEYLRVIPLLAEEFHVVVPSLPGYGFSPAPATSGWGIERIATAWKDLMLALGYERFGAQGSDWGTSITTCLALQHPEHLAGIHLVPPLVAPDPATLDDPTAAERAAVADLDGAHDRDGYSHQMSTRPQTLGYALDDSPAGLLAWIGEKVRAWSDPGSALTDDDVLDLVSTVWLTRSATSSARLYWESFATVSGWFTAGTRDTVAVPTGCSVFPYENPRPSRRWTARRFTDIRHWGEPERGGHFAALEQPELLAAELRAFFALVR